MKVTFKQITKAMMWTIEPGYIIMLLRSVALALLFILGYLVWDDWENRLNLLAVIGVLIAALLASFSVILSINSAVEIKKREIENQNRHLFANICQAKLLLSGLKLGYAQQEEISYLDFLTIQSIFNEVSEIIDGLNNHEAFGVIHNAIIGDLVLLQSYAKRNASTFENLAKSIQWPSGIYSGYKHTNPLKKINLNIENQLDFQNRILNYLKSGYGKLFEENGGIEQCASKKFELKLYEE